MIGMNREVSVPPKGTMISRVRPKIYHVTMVMVGYVKILVVRSMSFQTITGRGDLVFYFSSVHYGQHDSTENEEELQQTFL